ncbi:hypothetical protein PIB30_081961 [Stylosanthes scabra]|uniref:Uncharacterized protein n=1 Tax=Stylosanthes scabra TaxID=79078 RepID=A0ABU6RRQ3_9FABA|nr:hypothetical protein [Stylosanthes scabra]
MLFSILKKFDKRFGYRFTGYYVKTRANHPYSQLQQVFKDVGFGSVVGALSHNGFSALTLNEMMQKREVGHQIM